MFETMFPKQLTNDYQGSLIAKRVFLLVTIVTIGRSFIHAFAPYGGAQSIATIPLDSFTQNGAAAVILIFALWGLSQLLLGFIFIVVLWRYQTLIPFMYLLVIVEYMMRILLGTLKPMEITGTAPGGVGNYIVVPLASIMLFLSLRSSKRDTQ
jgi:hypothetical protein